MEKKKEERKKKTVGIEFPFLFYESLCCLDTEAALRHEGWSYEKSLDINQSYLPEELFVKQRCKMRRKGRRTLNKSNSGKTAPNAR